MDTKHFNVLAIAAAVSLVTAGIVHSAYDTWSVETVTGEKLFASFDKDASRVASVMLQKGKETFTFKKDNKGGWSLTERGGYPVEPEKVRELLVKLARTELVEAKTRDPQRYALLELGDPAKDGAKSTLVRMGDDAGKTVGELVVGKKRASAFGRGKSGSYVRRPGDDQTWLANVELDASTSVSDWVKPVFFRMALGEMSNLTLDPPDGDSIKIVADPAKKDTFKFESIPTGKKPKAGVDATVMIKALETLEMTDVRQTAEAKVQKGTSSISAVLETTDAMKLQFKVLKVGENDRWLSIDVLAEGKKKDVAKKLKEELEGWQFKIADWRSRQVFKTTAEMFEDKPEPKPEPKVDGAVKPVVPVQPKQ